MREMHKWKDKVELSLDNRQIFFLFFGLSVVGCFVFALGVMVGRRVDFGSTGEVAALASDGLALLSDEGQAEGMPAAALSFEEGLAEPATAGLPPTRDPSTPPAPEYDGKDAAAPTAEKVTNGMTGKKGKNPVAGAKTEEDAVLAKAAASSGDEGSKAAPQPASSSDDRKFTLQMKAFSRPEEAEAFAAPLRANGHDVRVEAHEVKGRIWHRVRMGEFTNWEDGIAAKETFEKREKVIAYVVRI
jgi:septal ring-binding cell division protein DamX